MAAGGPPELRKVLRSMVKLWGGALRQHLRQELRRAPGEFDLLSEPDVGGYVCGWHCDMVIGWFLAMAAVRPQAVLAPGGAAAEVAPVGRFAFLYAAAAEAVTGVRPAIGPLPNEDLPDSIVIAIGPDAFNQLYERAVALHRAVAGRLPRYATGLVRLSGRWLQFDDVFWASEYDRLGKRRWRKLLRDATQGRLSGAIPPTDPTPTNHPSPTSPLRFLTARRGRPSFMLLDFVVMQAHQAGSRSRKHPTRGAYRDRAGKLTEQLFHHHRGRDPGEWAASAGRLVSRLCGRVGLLARLPRSLVGTELHRLLERLDVFRRRSARIEKRGVPVTKPKKRRR